MSGRMPYVDSGTWSDYSSLSLHWLCQHRRFVSSLASLASFHCHVTKWMTKQARTPWEWTPIFTSTLLLQTRTTLISHHFTSAVPDSQPNVCERHPWVAKTFSGGWPYMPSRAWGLHRHSLVVLGHGWDMFWALGDDTGFLRVGAAYRSSYYAWYNRNHLIFALKGCCGYALLIRRQ